jgi:anti-anti-sigma regulatory factor
MSTAGAAAVIRLPSAITINNVAELHRQLRTRLQGGTPLLLDGSAVQTLDGAGIQLLLALANTAQQLGAGLSWQVASEVLCDAGQQLGVTAMMRLPTQAATALGRDLDLA